MNHLDYVFFPQKPYIRNKAILVRNGGNDIWENNSSKFMDPALQTIVQRSKIDMDLQSYLPVIEFVNDIPRTMNDSFQLDTMFIFYETILSSEQ